MVPPVYLDYNATTPLLDEVRDVMALALADGWGNPSSHHWEGRVAKRLLDEGRAGVAGAIDYSMKFENTVDTRSAEIVDGEFVDDLAALGGTTTR